MKELIVEAKASNLDRVIAFVNKEIGDFGQREKNQIALAAEEIFVNIAAYSYGEETGVVSIQVEGGETAVITFSDSGAAFNPFDKPSPDLTLSAEERMPGGLGIFLARKAMDEMSYEYRDGKNILTMKKLGGKHETK